MTSNLPGISTVPNIHTMELQEYSQEMADGIGRLMPQLDPAFSGEPTPEPRLRRIIDSPFHGQIVVVRNEVEVIGAATVSTILEPGFEGQAYLGGVVSDTAYREQGFKIGARLMRGVIDWADSHEMNEVELLTETDKPTNPAGFYKYLGAKLRPTTQAYYFDLSDHQIPEFE